MSAYSIEFESFGIKWELKPYVYTYIYMYMRVFFLAVCFCKEQKRVPQCLLFQLENNCLTKYATTIYVSFCFFF